MNLPPLTEKISPGAPGGHEFERLMHQLLLRYGDKHGFVYEPVSGRGGDGGIDGIVRKGGVPGLAGPVGFQFKWLWEDIHKGNPRRQIEDSLERAQRNEALRHWVLVTPWDLKESEREWLMGLPLREGLEAHHWGQERIDQLFELAPALFARYYPETARERIAGYDGFDFKGFAEQYRQRLALAHRKLRTLGLPPETLRERDASREIRLRDVFVPLQLVPSGEDARRPLQEFLHRRQSVVVLGDPGTGKTTLLTFLALLHAGEAKLPEFQPTPEAVPILVFLRDFIRLQKTDPKLEILDFVTQRARTDHNLPRAHRAFFEAVLAMGEAIVLFDGLDEAGSQAARRRMATVVRTFRAQYPSCPVWVTSRIYGYTGDIELPAEEFQKTRLASLDEPQIDDFVRRWYLQQLSHNEREREEQVKRLREAVRRTPSVRRLAGNPLLLTLMAFIHHGLRRLPQDRGELYEKCIDMLLKSWQEAKHEEGQNSGHKFEELKLHLNIQQDYLAHLALHIQEHSGTATAEEARGLVSRVQALNILADRHYRIALRSRPQLSLAEARDEMAMFLDYISDQTGLIIDRGGDFLSFIHLSFQEYLAAWVFTCSTTLADVNFFLRYIGIPAWEEVLLLRMYILLRTHGGSGGRTLDKIVQPLLRKFKWEDAFLGKFLAPFDLRRREKSWLTLTRTIRDNLELTETDSLIILRRALRYWLAAPSFEGEWFAVLEEVQLFAENGRQMLEKILTENLLAKSPADVIAGLHLAHRLTDIPDVTGNLLQSRRDLSALLSDLVLFSDNLHIGELLAQESSIVRWLPALTALDSPTSFLHSLAQASQSGDTPSTQLDQASLALLWRKIIADFDSRNKFASPRLQSDGAIFFRQDACIVANAYFHEVNLPFTSLRVAPVDFGETKDFFIALLCPDLAERALGLHGADDLDLLLEAWLQNLLPRLLEPTMTAASDQEKVPRENVVRALARALVHDFFSDFVRDFVRASARAFAHDLVRDFVGASVRAFVRTSFRASVRDFFSDLLSDVADDLFSDFGRALGPAFGRDFGQILAHTFVHDFVRDFSRAFVHDFSIDPDAADWEEQLISAREKEEQQDKLLSSWQCRQIGADFTSFKINERPTGNNFSLQIKISAAMPLCMSDLWSTIALAYLHSLFRYSIAKHPEGAITAQAIKSYINHYPFEVFPVALTWQERAKKLRTHLDSLHGTRGALLLTHATFASLMTGLSLDSPEWNHLVEHRDRNDVLIEASHLFYQICRFENPEANAERLKQIARESTGEAREVFEAAGLLDQPR